MSGKPKQKQYQYSSLEDGLKYLRSFESRQEVCDLYYDGSEIPFYQDGNVSYKLPNSTYICNERLGREGLRKAIRKWEDPTIYQRKGDRGIVLLNGLGEEVGFIKNRRILDALINTTIGEYNSKLFKSRITNVSFGKLNFIYDDTLYKNEK